MYDVTYRIWAYTYSSCVLTNTNVFSYRVQFSFINPTLNFYVKLITDLTRERLHQVGLNCSKGLWGLNKESPWPVFRTGHELRI